MRRGRPLYPIDFEDGVAGQPLQHIKVQNNIIDRWSWEPTYTGHAIVGDGSTGLVPYDDVVIDGNTLRGGDQATSTSDPSSGPISFWGDDAKTNFAITNNVMEVPPAPWAGWAMRFMNVDGLTITGNTMPLDAGEPTSTLAKQSGCTNVTISGNSM